MELPNFRSIPLLVVGIPVVRAKCCFACVMPKALLQEKESPGIPVFVFLAIVLVSICFLATSAVTVYSSIYFGDGP